MEEKKFEKIKKYPYLGSSKNLIEHFLIIGFETPFKSSKLKEIIKQSSSSVKPQESKNKTIKDSNELKLHYLTNRPVILNKISSNNVDAILNEEAIIN